MFRVQKISNKYIIYGKGKRRLPETFRTRAQANAYIVSGQAQKALDEIHAQMLSVKPSDAGILPSVKEIQEFIDSSSPALLLENDLTVVEFIEPIIIDEALDEASASPAPQAKLPPAPKPKQSKRK